MAALSSQTNFDSSKMRVHSQHEYTIKRVYSSPSMTEGTPMHYITYNNRVGPYKRYHREYDLSNDFYWDKRHNSSSLFWPTHVLANRRYYHSDPSYSFWAHYPQLTNYPRYDRCSFMDSADPLVSRRYRDPYYDRPLWTPARPWAQDLVEPKRVLQLYKQNLIGFDSVQRNWLAPYSWERRWNEYKEPYQQPTWTTSSPMRYHYSFGAE